MADCDCTCDHTPTFDTDTYDGTVISIAAGRENGRLTAEDEGAIAAVLKLARKIDAWDRIVEWAWDDKAGKHGWEGKPVVPEHDNVSISAYLKYCESLGLTPAGRTKLPKPKEAAPVGRLHSIKAAADKTRGRTASGA